MLHFICLNFNLLIIKLRDNELSQVAHAYNLCTQEANSGGP
jgi:hypothetical protein